MEVNLSPELRAKPAHIAAENNSGRVAHLRSVFEAEGFRFLGGDPILRS
jgi:hypothetical protein